MADFRFYQPNPLGPALIGDYGLAPNGSLDTVSSLDSQVQDATIRLLTARSSSEGFEIYPNVGVNLQDYLGQTITMELLNRIDQECIRSLVGDRLLPVGTEVRAVPQDNEKIMIYVLPPDAPVIKVPLDFSVSQGMTPTDEGKPTWLWRRGSNGIEQGTGYWRGWFNGQILWNLSLTRLTIAKSVLRPLTLGLFPQPLAMNASGFIFSGQGPTPELFQPRAFITEEGWISERALTTGDLPQYRLGDGVHCTEATGWDTVLVIDHTVAAVYLESSGVWKFRAVQETL